MRLYCVTSKFHLKKQYIGGEVINTAINTESLWFLIRQAKSVKYHCAANLLGRESLDAQPDFWQEGTSSFVIGTSFNAFYGPD